MTARCPSDLALEAFLLQPERSPLREHLDACAPCRTRVARMEAEGEEFRRFVFPATVAAIEEAARPRRSRWAFLLAPVGALAVAAAALLVVRTGPAAPPADYVGTKGGGGGGLALGVYVGAEDGARLVVDGDPVPAAGALRFKVTAASPCRLWIVSVDGAGQVSRLFPPEGDRAEPRGAGEVPGGARLDGQVGPERLFAVCAGEAHGWDDVRRAASAAGAGPDAVRRAHALGAPLADAPQSTLLVEKTR